MIKAEGSVGVTLSTHSFQSRDWRAKHPLNCSIVQDNDWRSTEESLVLPSRWANMGVTSHENYELQVDGVKHGSNFVAFALPVCTSSNLCSSS